MNLELHLTEKQVLTQQMILSLRLLQMNSIELWDYLESYAQENPVVTLNEPAEVPEDPEAEKLWRMQEFLAADDHENTAWYGYDRKDVFNRVDESQWKDGRTAEKTLAEELSPQIPRRDLTGEETAVLEFLIDSLDSRGYLPDSAEEISEVTGAPVEEVASMIQILQGMEPAGVGARDLRECLLLQLSRLDHPLPAARQIIETSLEDLARRHTSVILRKLGISRGEFEEAAAQIRSLDPRPGSAYRNGETSFVTPDILVIPDGSGFSVALNEAGMPTFHIDEEYQKMAKESDDREARTYLNRKIREARSVSRLLDGRISTLTKVASALVRRQTPFFREGPGHRSAMRLRDIAEDVGMSESTISRTFRSKYLQCSWGCYPLTYFLTKKAPSSGGEEGTDRTTEQAYAKLREIISGEDKARPLSDDALSRAMKEAGFPISRRTVNKYRNLLGIPDKSGRKEG